MPKTAPSKERASWERREARACSGEDIWRFVKGSHIRLCVCEREIERFWRVKRKWGRGKKYSDWGEWGRACLAN